MPILLPKGTKEFLVVVVADRLGNIDDLADAADVTFTVLDETDTKVVDAESTNIQDKLSVLCLVDTSGWTEGSYRLFVDIDISPQTPKLGPFRFDVEDYGNDAGPPIVT